MSDFVASCIDHLDNTMLLSYVRLLNVDTLHHLFLQKEYICFLILPEKSLGIGKL